MKIADLKRKASRGTLEVEHLLQAAIACLPDLTNELQQLAAQFNWKSAEECQATREVPLATWAKVAGAYAHEGLAGLHALRHQHPLFCVGILEQVRSEAAVEALLTWWPEAISAQNEAPDFAWRIAMALNQILSFKGAPEIAEASCASVRQLAHGLYSVAGSEPQRAMALLLLRGVGDGRSLVFVSQANEFEGAWADTKRSVAEAIRRRIGSARNADA
jgi:hypothetical protein